MCHLSSFAFGIKICLFYRLSLIQLAVHDKVYILDLMILFECLETEDWDKLLDGIFGNPNLIKLGKKLIIVIIYLSGNF